MTNISIDNEKFTETKKKLANPALAYVNGNMKLNRIID